MAHAEIPERVLDRIRAMPQGAPDECWEWTGLRTRLGHGDIHWRTNWVRGHTLLQRVSWEAFRGPIPEGLVIDHLCCNPPCWNPAHLEPVTLGENTRRANAAKTHCFNGHAWTSENTVYESNGAFGVTRRCATCRAENRRKDRERKMAVT